MMHSVQGNAMWCGYFSKVSVYSTNVYFLNIVSTTVYVLVFKGTEVFDINIQDIDTIGTITYQITSGNTNSSFIIDSSGIVTVSAVGLDFESVTSFMLEIQISDGIQMVCSNIF